MEEKREEKIFYLRVEDILPNRFQPRLAFDEKELNELSNSIIKYGVIQPIVVRKIADKYEIIAGERRYKAACLAGLQTIPAIINNTDDNTSAEIALLENLQRKNLTAIEEAQSYKKLIDKGFTQEDIASKLSISQSSIANKLRLLSLPNEVKDALLYGKISERHARSLLSLNNEDLQKSILNRIINEKLTVKQTEDEISSLLIRNNQKDRDYIPEEIQRFLRPQEKKEEIQKSEEIETLDFSNIPVADVVNILPTFDNKNIEEIKFEESISDYENINPYQLNAINEKVESDISNKVRDSKEIYEEIKNYADSLSKNNDSIKITPLDLMDKYQIIIQIDKY